MKGVPTVWYFVQKKANTPDGQIQEKAEVFIRVSVMRSIGHSFRNKNYGIFVCHVYPQEYKYEIRVETEPCDGSVGAVLGVRTKSSLQ